MTYCTQLNLCRREQAPRPISRLRIHLWRDQPVALEMWWINDVRDQLIPAPIHPGPIFRPRSDFSHLKLRPDPVGSTLPVGMASRRDERCEELASDPLCHGGSASRPAVQATRECALPTCGWVTRTRCPEDLARGLGVEAGPGARGLLAALGGGSGGERTLVRTPLPFALRPKNRPGRRCQWPSRWITQKA